MKTRRSEIALVAGGILLGATLTAPVAGAALTAQESMQQIYVDGKLAQMEAYSISGHNYRKTQTSEGDDALTRFAKTSGLQSKIRQNPNQIFLPLVKPFPLDFRVLSEYCLCRERM